MFGVSQKGARKWLEGEAIPATARLGGIATKLSVNFEWLMSGTGPQSTGNHVADYRQPYQAATVPVRYYPDIYASAGHGCLPVSEATVTVMEVAQALLLRKGVDPDDAALVQADGDSMRGTVDHGDIMLIHLADNQPRDGRVYVVSVGDDVLVKRVQRIPHGIKLIADNPAYDAIEIMEEDQQTPVNVIGRVVIAWHSRELLE